MIRKIRLNSKGPSAEALKDRRQLTKARAIDQHEVIALREAGCGKTEKGSATATTAFHGSLFFSHTKYTPQAQSKKRPNIKESDCEFGKPAG
jgi:hypothetical protein